MYAGHLGFALGAYSFRRTIPLWLILIASQLPDWLDAGMCLASLSRGPSGLFTHGLYTLSISAIGLAAIYAIFARDIVGGFIIALTVYSHYALDFLTGQKPTWAGGPVIGLSLYSRPAIDLLIESVTILIGWALYRRTTPEENRDDFTVYAVLFALVGFQLLAGIAFYYDVGGTMKC